MNNSLPSLEDIFGKRISTIKYIPRNVRSVFAKCVTSALANINLENSMAAWTEFFMLPKALLNNIYSKGKKHRKHMESSIKNRCTRWLNNERKTLWDELVDLKTKINKENVPNEERIIREAKALCHEGQFSKASKRLISDPLCEVNEWSINQMKVKHPKSNTMSTCNPKTCNETHLPTDKQVSSSLFTFPKGSAPGPTSLRPQHLIDALNSNIRYDFLEQLTGVCNILAQGKAPKVLAKFLAGANLIGSPKKDTSK